MFHRGTTVADTIANAVQANWAEGIVGDIVWLQLCQAASPAQMQPLDAAASAQTNPTGDEIGQIYYD